MATYNVAGSEVGVWEKTLVANTTDTVAFHRDADKVRVTNVSGTSAIYFTVDGSDPTVGGQGTYWLPASALFSRTVDVQGGGETTVKIKSSGTPSYSCEGSTL